MKNDDVRQKALRIYTCFVACATFCLLVAGALVTSTGSGLAVPDWPLSFGQFFPPMIGGVFFEHGHRMIAGFVGILVGILAVAAVFSSIPRNIKFLSIIALGAIIVQALLGGLTVLMRLPPLVSVTHALLAQIVFSLIVSISVLLGYSTKGYFSKNSSALSTRLLRSTFRVGLFVVCLILGQVLLGAVIRHTGQGLNSHMGGAIVVSLGVLYFVGRVFLHHRESLFVRPAILLSVLLIFQLILGFGAWKSWVSHVIIRTSHVVVASMLLAITLDLAIRCFIFSSSDTESISKNSKSSSVLGSAGWKRIVA